MTRRKIHKEKRTTADNLRDKVRTKIGAHTILWFGKYRGSSVRHVLDIDPEYIRWAIGQGIFKLDDMADYEYGEAIRRDIHRRQEAGSRQADEERARRTRARTDRERAERASGEQARRSYHEEAGAYHWSGESSGFSRSDFENIFESFMGGGARNPFGSRQQRQRQQQRQAPPSASPVKVVSPAARWDHLPAKQKHASVLRLREVTSSNVVTKENLRQQYRKLALEYHPDKVGNCGPMLQELAHEMSLRVNAAYEYFKEIYGI